VEAGGRLEIRGVAPVAGTCLVELVSRRDSPKHATPSRSEFTATPVALADYSRTYELANDQRWTSRSLVVAKGEFATVLHVPPEAQGPCHVRIFIEGTDDFAAGSADVQVRAKKAEVSKTGALPRRPLNR
jgi:hypothetical protein